MQVHCSEDHMFCSSCLADYKDSSCPSCLELLDKSSFQLSKFVKRQISRLRVCCVYQSSGCAWEGILEDFHSHSQSCQFQCIPCPNSHNGCPDYIKPSDIDQHKSQCLYELMACPNGSIQCQPFLRKDSALHDSNCPSFKCPFAHEGCSFMGTLADVNRHCENYCGKLHERIKHLEQQCDQMKQQLRQHDETNATDAINNTSVPTTTPTPQDSSMDEMSLFHQMFNNGFMSITPGADDISGDISTMINNNKNDSTNNSNTEMMDLSTCLPDTSLLTVPTNQQQHQSRFAVDTPDTTASHLAMSTAAPKRSTNGKIIRYSKNKQLAHGALRMARQRTSSGSNLTTEAILHALQQGSKSGDGDVNMFSSSPPTPSTSACPLSSSLSSSTSSSSAFPVSATSAAPTPYTLTHHQQPSSAISPTNPLPNLKTKAAGPSSDNNGEPISNPAFSFKNLDDVTKFLEELQPMVEATPFLSSSQSRKSGPSRHDTKGNNGRTEKRKIDDEGSNKQQPQQHQIVHSGHRNQQGTSNASPSSSSVSTNKAVVDANKSSNKSPARPMYVLASTLLAKRSQGS
ncbi:hypothetical protein BCR42DRAFT_77412 [Absidia repens]|uniref:TRAF-type domain-containing protein n=1 Tax=Absidia repens TaxID=90262 RepID=A0A1X2IAP0_9FUNG|nr:hypothetical protein BCR42DRAFT_77412 [Absidia repens]